MAGVFAKLAPNIRRHPKCRKAGRDGTDVFIHVLCVNADRGATGVVPAAYVEPWFLADEIQMDEPAAAEGLRRAVEAELLEVLPDGSVLIIGWDEKEWGRARDSQSMTEAERKRIQRDKEREEKRAIAAKKATSTKKSGHVRTPSRRPDHADIESDVEQESEKELPAAPVGEPKPAKDKLPRKVADSPHARVIAAWDALYTAATGSPASWGGRQGEHVRRLLKHGETEVITRMRRLWDGALDFLKSPYDIGDLERWFDKLAEVVNGNPRAGPGPAQRPLKGMSAMHAILERQAKEPAP